MLERSLRQLRLRLGLDLHEDEHELRAPIVNLEPRNEIRLPAVALGEVGEDLLVATLRVPEVQAPGESREEQLEKLLHIPRV